MRHSSRSIGYIGTLGSVGWNLLPLLSLVYLQRKVMYPSKKERKERRMEGRKKENWMKGTFKLKLITTENGAIVLVKDHFSSSHFPILFRPFCEY